MWLAFFVSIFYSVYNQILCGVLGVTRVFINHYHAKDIYLYGNIRFDVPDKQYYDFNTSKLKSLEFKFKTIQEMFDDRIASLVEKGHLREFLVFNVCGAADLSHFLQISNR